MGKKKNVFLEQLFIRRILIPYTQSGWKASLPPVLGVTFYTTHILPGTQSGWKASLPAIDALTRGLHSTTPAFPLAYIPKGRKTQ